jgi:Tfp pilus assembly protein PilF
MRAEKNSFSPLIRKIKKFRFIILISAAAAAYALGIHGQFVTDDIELIQHDNFYKNETNPLKTFTRSYWKQDRQQNLYRPVTLLFYWIQYKTYSLFYDPDSIAFQSAFRFFNLLVHITVVLLLYIFLRKIPISFFVSFASALIFAVHPIHSEAVIPACGLAELLCALFLLSALIFHAKALENRKFLIPAGISAFLAFLSKEHAVMIPAMVIAFDLFCRKKPEDKLNIQFIRKKTPVWSIYFISAASVFVLHKLFLGCFIPDKKHFCPGIDNPLALTDPLIRFISAVKIQGYAILKFLCPVTLSHDYSYAQIVPCTLFYDPYALLSLFLFIAVPFIAVKLFPDCRNKIFFLCSAFFLSVIPAGNFIIPAGTVFAERLQYIPTLFLTPFFVYILISARRYIPFPAVLLLITVSAAALAGRTALRTFDWQNSETLALSALKTAPHSVKTWNNLAVIYIRKQKYPEAMAACSKSISIYPQNSTAYANRAYAFMLAGDFKSAENDIKEIRKIEKNNFYASFLYGYILLHKGKKSEAQAHWQKLLKKYPGKKIIRNALENINISGK